MQKASFIFFLLIGTSLLAQKSGDELYNLGKYKEAEAAYRQELKVSPNSYELHMGYANSLHKQDLFEKAL